MVGLDLSAIRTQEGIEVEYQERRFRVGVPLTEAGKAAGIYINGNEVNNPAGATGTWPTGYASFPDGVFSIGYGAMVLHRDGAIELGSPQCTLRPDNRLVLKDGMVVPAPPTAAEIEDYHSADEEAPSPPRLSRDFLRGLVCGVLVGAATVGLAWLGVARSSPWACKRQSRK
ncbi:hypothetical protein N2152v2_000722 [Parachlorella kessleri]